MIKANKSPETKPAAGSVTKMAHKRAKELDVTQVA